MPELPEVELVRRWVEETCLGHVLHKTTLLDPQVMRRGELCVLHTLTLVAAERIGKYLLLRFGDPEASEETHRTMILHLRMTGRFEEISQGTEVLQPWRFVLDFGGVRFGFRDVRRLGHAEVVGPDEIRSLRATFGPEPWPRALPGERLYTILQKTRRAVKVALMDQSLLAGVGNIIAQEALWRAQIHPQEKSNALDVETCAALSHALRDVCGHTLEQEDGPLPKYVGEPGGDRAEVAYFDVYGRAGQECRRQGCTTRLLSKKIAGRGTVWCPECQRLNV